MDMDSAGWADVEVLGNNVEHEQGMPIDWDDLLILATTAPKGRIQLGLILEERGGQEVLIEKFIRVNQGHSIPFVREERVAHVIESAAELKSRVCDLWHGTSYDAVPDILRSGLVPGGRGGGRNSVYLATLAPWDDDFGEVSRYGSDAFRIHMI